ncbi:general secretion pathway protein GspK [Alkalisalibacterium limincola]|uniref:General secretion pathway protein GspK n=1 Tax=Alkalisalibacterium limincola TaxID=2699169 RepID=A0A5C8KU63_9GAMM|nr:PilX N-terminal domain-containing pilus assembly protein [Alkalisalibacterium limincola]TXK64996.1 general secretion pathway protein GspK [Alkalisalibacterium limincola]
MNRGRGVALVLVLWVLVLLTALLSSFAIVARSEAQMARQLRDATQATYAAEAGVELALLRVADTDPDWRWIPDGRPYEAEFDGARLQVEVLDETAKLDLNLADPATLTRFFLGIGLNEDDAMRAADVIVDFRDADDLTQPMGAEAEDYRAAGLPYGPKNAPFERVEELQQVLGMTPELFQRSAPHLTVHTGSMPNPAFASAPVLAALGFDPGEVEGMIEERAALGELGRGLPSMPDPSGLMVGSGSGTYSIRSVAWLPDGAKAELNVTLRVAPVGVPGPAFVLLSRHEGEAYQ